MMRLPYIVVDQNCMRDEVALNERLVRAREHGELIVLADTAFIEMMKNAKWELTIEKSLNILAKYPEGIVASYSPGRLLRMERRKNETRRTTLKRGPFLMAQRIG